MNEKVVAALPFLFHLTTMKRAFLLRLALGLILTSCLPSCSSGFRSAWKAGGYVISPNSMITTQESLQNQLPPGKWEGTWHSDANGHQGTLRCVTSSAFNIQGDHEFFYRATWKKILSGSYKAVHTVKKQKDGTYTFKGTHKMPKSLGGLYQYEGTIKGDEFNACYQCSMDKGTYTMKRVR